MEQLSEWATVLPAPPLRPFIDSYVGYRLSGFTPSTHRGLPSRHLTFIVSIGPAIDVTAQTDPQQAPASYRCVVSGLQARPATIRYGSHQEGVAVQLNPLGARVLFGLPSRALWDTSVECADVVGLQGWDLWERLQSIATWEGRFAVCDDVLGHWARRDVVVPAVLGHVWRALVPGAVAVEDLAAEVGWSRQHLARRFGDEFGLAPKLAARVVRFDRARSLLQSASKSIAQVAAACSYFDQAHFSRDVTELAGCTPVELRAEELPFFQDEEAAPG